MLVDSGPGARTGGRRGATLPVVLILVVIASVAVFSAALYRRHAARDLAALLHRSRAYEVGEAAVREVCGRRKLEAFFNQPEVQRRLTAAFEGGTWLDGYTVRPAPLGLELSADVTAERFGTDGPIEVGLVSLEIPEYRTADENQGTLRGIARVRYEAGGRVLDYAVALDFPVQFRKVGGRVLVLVARTPRGWLAS